MLSQKKRKRLVVKMIKKVIQSKRNFRILHEYKQIITRTIIIKIIIIDRLQKLIIIFFRLSKRQRVKTEPTTAAPENCRQPRNSVPRSKLISVQPKRKFVPNYSAINRVTCFRLSHGTLFVVAASNKSPPYQREKKIYYTCIPYTYI